MKRILIVRSSAIGDVVFASPIAAAIKRSYPDVYVAWLIEPGIDALIAHDPNIDERIIWPKSEWKALWQAKKLFQLLDQISTFRKKLHELQFDTAFDLQGLMKSGLLAWLAGAPRRIGLGSREGSQYLMTEVVSRGGDASRISSEYLYLAQSLGLECDDFIPRLYLNPEANKRALERIQSLGLTPGKYAVFAAFTTRPQKHWFDDAWQRLASLMHQQTGMVPVLLGGPDDIHAAERLASGAQSIVNLAGKTRLDEAAALVRHAGAIVGVDTGLTHMGIAFGVPTVAIFGSTCPYIETCRGNARVIWLGMACSPCKRKPTCGGTWTCLRDITPERVMTELDMALRLPA